MQSRGGKIYTLDSELQFVSRRISYESYVSLACRNHPGDTRQLHQYPHSQKLLGGIRTTGTCEMESKMQNSK